MPVTGIAEFEFDQDRLANISPGVGLRDINLATTRVRNIFGEHFKVPSYIRGGMHVDDNDLQSWHQEASRARYALENPMVVTANGMAIDQRHGQIILLMARDALQQYMDFASPIMSDAVGHVIGASSGGGGAGCVII